MKKSVKWILIIVVSLVVILYVSLRVLMYQTKSHSPEEIITYTENGSELSVYYNRPYKKGRKVFGKLVPYNEVWRTGANEATTFSTAKDLKIGNDVLPKGTYTLWTIPGKKEWAVIFNSKEYGWGVRMKDGKPSREAEFDVLKYISPVEKNNEVVEQFTIRFQGEPNVEMLIEWDKIRVSVPLH